MLIRLFRNFAYIAKPDPSTQKYLTEGKRFTPLAISEGITFFLRAMRTDSKWLFIRAIKHGYIRVTNSSLLQFTTNNMISLWIIQTIVRLELLTNAETYSFFFLSLVKSEELISAMIKVIDF